MDAHRHRYPKNKEAGRPDLLFLKVGACRNLGTGSERDVIGLG